MPALSKQRVALFVERSCRQWVVRDPEGSFWILPSVSHPWEHRQPFHPTPETDLEPVPGHYKDMLELPF
jgi:hypothetical protein